MQTTANHHENYSNSHLLLQTIFDFGSLSINYLAAHVATVQFDIDFNELNYLPLSKISIHALIDEVFACINRQVFSYLINAYCWNDSLDDSFIDKLNQLCQQRIQESDLSINSVCSYFNNELDQVNTRNTTIDVIATEVAPILISSLKNTPKHKESMP